ncbi:MAG: hypothetical protein N2380_00150 [bacterium]|nr:hypothetical protein [bacterium]
MSKVLARKYVNVPLENTQERQSTIPQRAIYPWIKSSFILVLLFTSILTLGLLQIKLYNTLVFYREGIRSLEEAIDNLSIKNEMLRLEVERLTSPSRLKEEGKRLNLQPSDRVVILPED